MAGSTTRNRRGTFASTATPQGTAALDTVAEGGATFETATAVEDEVGSPPSAQRRRFISEEPQDRQLSIDPVLSDNEDLADSTEDEEERLRLTFEELAKQQRITAYKEKIAMMEKGDKIPEGMVGAAPAVTPLLAVASPAIAREPTPNMAHIPEYNVSNIKDHHEWERTWHRLHAVSPAYYASDINKINVAATKLSGPIADGWEREEKTVASTAITWRFFCDYLLNYIDDPTNRHATMYKAWRRSTQRGDEDLHTYYQRLETIQAEIPELSEEIKRMHLLSTMREGLRRKLVDLQLDGLPRHELLKKGSSLE